MNEANRIAREAAQRQLRPYVHIDNIAPKRPIPTLNAVEIKLRNFGQTPATSIETNIGICYCPFDHQSWPRPTAHVKLGRYIAPGHFQRVTIGLEDWLDEIAKMVAGEGELRFTFQVFYSGYGIERASLKTRIIYNRDGAQVALMGKSGSIT